MSGMTILFAAVFRSREQVVCGDGAKAEPTLMAAAHAMTEMIFMVNGTVLINYTDVLMKHNVVDWTSKRQTDANNRSQLLPASTSI